MPSFSKLKGTNWRRFTPAAIAGAIGAGLAFLSIRGVRQKVTHLNEKEKPQPDDATLAHKVETEIFRGAEVPKGQINVNAEEGVVFLRGVVRQREQIDDLGEAAAKVEGVTAVENLLRPAGTPAPSREDDGVPVADL